MSVGPPRWTWQSTCSTACWSWAPELRPRHLTPNGAGVSAPTPLIRATQPLQAAESQGPDQPDEAPPQGEIRLAPATVHADPLPIHGLQFGLDRKDEHLDVGQGIPAVAAAGPGNASGRRRRQISGAQGAGAKHRPDMVSPSLLWASLCARTALQHELISRTASNSGSSANRGSAPRSACQVITPGDGRSSPVK